MSHVVMATTRNYTRDSTQKHFQYGGNCHGRYFIRFGYFLLGGQEKDRGEGVPRPPQ